MSIFICFSILNNIIINLENHNQCIPTLFRVIQSQNFNFENNIKTYKLFFLFSQKLIKSFLNDRPSKWIHLKL